jgi:hypothetical protein
LLQKKKLNGISAIDLNEQDPAENVSIGQFGPLEAGRPPKKVTLSRAEGNQDEHGIIFASKPILVIE